MGKRSSRTRIRRRRWGSLSRKTPVNLQSRKAAIRKLNEIQQRPTEWRVIHYSCESFYDRKDGTSPRITSIAVRDYSTGQTQSYSIHQVAERSDVAIAEIGQNYDSLERHMLEEFYDALRKDPRAKYIHWNMRDVNYGFQAIEHRIRVLKGEPIVVSDDRKLDLARTMVDKYGKGYVGHPRQPSLLKKNSIKPKDMMSGQEEADAFDSANYVGLHQSTLRKVDVIHNVAELAINDTLKTDATWIELNGGRFKGLFSWLADNPLFIVGSILIGIALSVLGIFLS